MNCGQLVPSDAAPIKVKTTTQSAPVGRQRLSDIRPPKRRPEARAEQVKVVAPKPTSVPVESKKAVAAAKQAPKTEPKPAQAPQEPTAPRQILPDQVQSVAKQLKAKALTHFGNVVGATTALPLALATIWLFSPLNGTIGTDQLRSSPTVVAIFGAVLIAYKIMSVLVRYWATGSTVFAATRLYDHREASKKSLYRVGFNTLLKLWLFDLLILSIVVPVVIACLATSTVTGATILLNLPLAVVLIAVFITRMLGRNLIILTNQSIFSAFRLGVTAAVKDFASLVSKIWPAVGVNIAYMVFLAGIDQLVIYGASELPQDWIVAVSAGLLGFVIVMHASAWVFKFNCIYWLGIYRNLAKSLLPDRFSSLLTGRQPHKSKNWIGAIVILLVLATIAGAYQAVALNHSLVTGILWP